MFSPVKKGVRHDLGFDLEIASTTRNLGTSKKHSLLQLRVVFYTLASWLHTGVYTRAFSDL